MDTSSAKEALVLLSTDHSSWYGDKPTREGIVGTNLIPVTATGEVEVVDLEMYWDPYRGAGLAMGRGKRIRI
mgnify:CR=1 FL=1|jgi:hypothetical protein